MTELRRGQLVRLEDRHDLLDALVALEPEALHDGCARAPQLSMRSMTERMSSSVAVGFMTIIICVLLEKAWLER